MKQKKLFITLLFFTLQFPIELWAEKLNLNDTFIADGIKYMVTSTEPLEVQVEGEYMNPAVGENWVGEVIIPASVQDLEGYTYAVTGISNYAFNYCSKVTSVNISNSVKRIGYSAFEGCTSLVSISLPNSITTIEDCTFSGCIKLASISIPNTVTKIGWNAFYYCESLTELFIPKSVTAIDEKSKIGAFGHCSGLTSIVVEEGNPMFDSRDNCNAIINKWNGLVFGCKSTIIPKSVDMIGRYAFDGCSGLTKFDIPSWIYQIEDNAFKDCTGLTSVFIPKTITSIGGVYPYNIFQGCYNLTSIVVEDGHPRYDSRNNCNAIIETESNILFSGCQNTIIPNTVKKIQSYTFEDIINLKSIEIPNGVTEIGESTFSRCQNLESVSLPRTLTHIGRYAFQSCKNLTTLTIPMSVKSIGDYAFIGCEFVSVTSELKEPISIRTGDTFGYNRHRATLFVPIGSKSKYQAATGWKDFKYIEEIEMYLSVAGDVSGDGIVDTKDLIEVVNTMIGKASDGIDINAADLNGDGIINIADIIQIVNLIFNNQ